MTRAWLIVVGACFAGGCRSITHWTPTPPAIQQPLKEFDVAWLRTDENGLPLNPLWGSQRTDSTLPMTKPGDPCAAAPQQCTTQLGADAIDEAPRPSLCRFGVQNHIDNAGPFAAHVNWAVAAYTGVLRPSMPPISNDMDFNFEFLSEGGNGLTFKNGVIGTTTTKNIELELDSNEVGERFGLGFWRDYANTAGVASCTDINATPGSPCGDAREEIERACVRGGRLSRAVITGLFGVDCEHGCKSEIHPVYALAVETKDGTAGAGGTQGNEWAIFARNWGNEGFCSTHVHEFDTKFLTILIPPPVGSTAAPTVTNATFAYSGDRVGTPAFRNTTFGGGLLATFELPDSSRHGLTELMLTIDWTGGAPQATAAPTAAAGRRAAANAPGAQSFETYVNGEVNRLPDTNGLSHADSAAH